MSSRSSFVTAPMLVSLRTLHPTSSSSSRTNVSPWSISACKHVFVRGAARSVPRASRQAVERMPVGRRRGERECGRRGRRSVRQRRRSSRGGGIELCTRLSRIQRRGTYGPCAHLASDVMGCAGMPNATKATPSSCNGKCCGSRSSALSSTTLTPSSRGSGKRHHFLPRCLKTVLERAGRERLPRSTGRGPAVDMLSQSRLAQGSKTSLECDRRVRHSPGGSFTDYTHLESTHARKNRCCTALCTPILPLAPLAPDPA